MAAVATREKKGAPLIESEGRDSIERTADVLRRILAVPKAEVEALERKQRGRRGARKSARSILRHV